MQRARILLAFGVWIAVLPYLGFPIAWKNIFFVVTGVGLAYFGYVLYREHKVRTGRQTFDNFSENRDFGREQPASEYGERN
ncbi:MAG: hypothetical protein WDN09_03510 [bacterium]